MSALRCTILAVVVGFGVTPAEAQLVPVAPAAEHTYSELMAAVYKGLADELNADFNFPEPIELTSGACNQPNAFYLPRREGAGPTIVMCTELLDRIVDQVRRQHRSSDLQTLAVVSQVLFVTLHEIGHALIDAFDVPVLGREEDAVDQLATLYFSEEPVLASWAAEFWRQGRAVGRRAVAMEAFADEHGLDEQRFFNIMCWTYGADAEVRGFLLNDSGLPEDRTRRCPAEFQQLKTSWAQLLQKHMKDPGAIAEIRQDRNSSGYWLFHESMTTADGSSHCTAAGSLTLWQFTSDLAGTMEQGGACLHSGVVADNAATTEIDSGTVTEDRVIFDIAGCRYEGTIDAVNRRRITGVVQCGTDPALSGTWEAIR